MKGEYRFHPFLALDGNVSSHQPDIFSADGEPQSRTRVDSPGRFRACEGFENSLEFILMDSDSRVCNSKGDRLQSGIGIYPFVVHAQGDASGFREFDAVSDQMEQNLSQFNLIRPDLLRNRFTVKMEEQSFSVSTRAQDGIDILQKAGQVEYFSGEYRLSGFDFRHVEDGVDQSQQMFSASLDNPGILHMLHRKGFVPGDHM